MSSRITTAFETAKQNKRCAFIPFITGGFPDSECFESLLKALDTSGADIIEVGIPFSDPLADGPVIQHSSKLALDMQITPQKILGILNKIKNTIKAPIVIMSYWNPIMQFGLKEFAIALNEAGVSGVIIPDLSPEESATWRECAESHSVDTIFMVAPTTSHDRIKKIASYSSGFVYLVSMTGVTGANLNMDKKLETQIQSVKSLTNLPVAVGFGISTPSQAGHLSSFADGIIVGSALVKKTIEAASAEEAIESVTRLSSQIAVALKN
ncbi:MAG: tryptophan synthase subunit alpha [Desulfomonilaceae bacterium]